MAKGIASFSVSAAKFRQDRGLGEGYDKLPQDNGCVIVTLERPPF